MKHVGLNVAADSLMYASMTGTEAGLVIISADDPNRDEVIGGAFATAFGEALAAKWELAGLSDLPTELSGTRVTVRDSAGVEHWATLLFVSPLQISFRIPVDCAPGFAAVRILSEDGTISLGGLWIGAASRMPD